jgi:hypothetical protein
MFGVNSLFRRKQEISAAKQGIRWKDIGASKDIGSSKDIGARVLGAKGLACSVRISVGIIGRFLQNVKANSLWHPAPEQVHRKLGRDCSCGSPVAHAAIVYTQMRLRTIHMADDPSLSRPAFSIRNLYSIWNLAIISAIW